MKNICIVVMSLSIMFISNSPVFAAKWYENYQEAEYLAEREEWNDVIDLLQQASDEEPNSGERKRTYGMRFIAYYPYLKLGEAYLEIGDIENAQRYCEKAQEKGAAPQEVIEDCFQKIAAVPTREDTVPALEFPVRIPDETDRATLYIQGVATDDYGIKDIKIVVKKVAEKGLSLDMVFEGKQTKHERLTFSKELQLELGRNEIIVEATDTLGQVEKQIFHVVRKDLTGEFPDEFISEVIERPGDVYAVIIGIGDYMNDWLDLRFTVNDARKFYEVLTDSRYGGVPEEHVQILLDQEATAQGIREALGKRLTEQAKREDTVIIYYSGHGAPEGEDTYWVTHNADIDDLYSTALSNNEIADILDSIQSERVLTFLDSCYSAATVQKKDRTRSIQLEIPWEKFSGKGRVVISASDGKQMSLELDEYQHGIFTYYLLKGLKGQADDNRDGVIEVDEIWDYVKYQVSETATKAGNPQTPVRQGPQTAGIPLTVNVSHLKQKILTELFQEELIAPEHFNCAVKMLSSDNSNPVLEGLLSGEIDSEVFRSTFQCDSQIIVDGAHLNQKVLAELFQKGLVEPDHFNCAFKMLSSGKSSPVLEGLLSGEIDPEVFRMTFQCDS